MKIALISPAYPLRGGIATSSERLATALQAAGHEVIIYSFKLQYPAFLFPGKTQYTEDAPPSGIQVVSLLNSVNPFNWLKSGFHIAKYQPDRVIVRYWLPFMGPCLGTVLRILRWKLGAALRITALTDNFIPHEKRIGDVPFSRYFAHACTDFVVMSRSVGKEIEQVLGPATLANLAGPLGITPIRFAPHPIYDTYGDALPKTAARAALKIPEKVPLILFFGLIRAYKGLDLLLEALQYTPDSHALVAGECYDDWNIYQKIIEQHQLSDRVHLHLRFIPSDEVKLYFSAADLVVQPYKNATQSGISQIAFHFGVPMVVTNVGGLPEIVESGKSGYVTEPDANDIAAAIQDFFQNNRLEAMQEQVQEGRKRFSWDYLVNSLLG
jgi:glycosyltransferase involved in cell wall biosynthesis